MHPFPAQNLQSWTTQLNQLFPVTLPELATWTKPQDIIAVLNHLASIPHSHSVFLAAGGDIAIASAGLAPESGLLSLRDVAKMPYYFQPQSLTFNSFGDPTKVQWNYFRLELETLQPVTPGPLPYPQEQLIELAPGTYQPFQGQEQGKSVMRLLSGSLVIFAKGSRYAINKDTYAAHHGTFTAARFRAAVQTEASK